jgi:hypothetical protein
VGLRFDRVSKGHQADGAEFQELGIKVYQINGQDDSIESVSPSLLCDDRISDYTRLDSSDKYVELLHQFCSSVQAIDSHLYNFTGPCSPSYHYLTPRIRSSIEARIVKAAEFTSAVVVPFILDDFRQFFVSRIHWNVMNNAD